MTKLSKEVQDVINAARTLCEHGPDETLRERLRVAGKTYHAWVLRQREPDAPRPYTVALIRPRCVQNEDLAEQDGMNPYLANQLMATSVEDAIRQARDELWKADFESDGWAVEVPEDFTREEYCVLYVFEGHLRPADYGYNWNKVVHRDQDN